MSASLHTKSCIRCGETKPLEEFYASPTTRDGRGGACKPCIKTGVRENYRRNRDYYVMYDKQREQRPERKAFKADAQIRYRERNPIKNKARAIVSRAVRSGALERPPCSKCGCTKNVHAHHHDYLKPLDVEWLCVTCHWAEHGSVLAEGM